MPDSTSTLASIARPLRKILGKLLTDDIRERVADSKTRAQLVLATDALLMAEAPEARLVPSRIRHALIARLIDNPLGATTGLESVISTRESVAALEAAMSPETVATLPEAGDLRALGVRGLTVKVAHGLNEVEAVALLKESVGGENSVEAFPSLPGIYTIRFIGEEKPLASEAWQIAQSLLANGQFTYAEPNLAIPAGSDGDALLEVAALEGLGPGPWDRNHPSTVTAFEWSLDRVGLKALWTHRRGSKGGGVVVGHIDTGYTLHPEVKQNLDRDRDFDYWDGDNDAQDPLSKSLSDRFRAFPVLNPGHGTGTASVIASPVGKQPATTGVAWVSGSAPEATLIPYRATPSVVIVPGGSQDEVARAISGAADAGVDVISMSLGAPWGSMLLRAAVEHALQKGVIVCAAAGNIVAEILQGDRVTYPAKYAGVVAVAGCDYDYVPWTRSCRGSEVDITAPGTDVWRAVATKNLNNAFVQRGSGTSFAVAAVAGVAACWIGRHGGRKAVRHHYGGNARLVPVAFLLALERHQKIPLVNGDPELFGGGVLNGRALADMSLPSIDEVEGALQRFTPPVESQLAALESISPATASSAAVADLFESWTGLRIELLKSDEIKQLATHLATQPQLLVAWWQAFSVRAPGLSLESIAATPPPERTLGLATALGLSPTLSGKLGATRQEAAEAALETAQAFR